VFRTGAKETLAMLRKRDPDVKLGLFTDEPRHLIHLEAVQAALDTTFDVVLTSADCYHTRTWTKKGHDDDDDEERKKGRKSIRLHFPGNANMVLIDDLLSSVVERDRFKVWTWDEQETMAWTCRTRYISRLDLEGLNCHRVPVEGTYMLEDPQMLACGSTSRYSVVQGGMGAGKSYAIMEILRTRAPDRNKCCVYVAPNRALAGQVAKALQLHLSSRGDQRTVLLYLARDARSAPRTQWDFLIIGPLSLRHFSEVICQRGVDLLILDELPDIAKLVTVFEVASEVDLQIARAGLATLFERVAN
jgi:hypothetical protein